MLKIKDNIDLKELEKFGFIFYSEKDDACYGCCKYHKNQLTIFINNARVISITLAISKTIFDMNILYDLIQAGIVEKI